MFTQATPVISQSKDVTRKSLDPFKLPDIEEGEEFHDYVCSVKPDAPIEYFQIGIVNFDKRVFPSAASDLNRKEEYFPPQFTVRKMTDKQAKSILARAKDTWVRIPDRRNPKFDPRNKESKELENIPAEVICLGDWIILCKVAEFSIAMVSPTTTQKTDIDQIDSKVDEHNLGAALIQENAKRAKK